MMIRQTLDFKSKAKKLHKNQIPELEAAVKKVCEEPEIGMKKKGDLSDVYVYKFKIKNVLHLLAYTWEEESHTLILLQLGVRENFYRDLK